MVSLSDVLINIKIKSENEIAILVNLVLKVTVKQLLLWKNGTLSCS